MNSNKKPQTRNEKILLLKSLLKGQIKIDDLNEKGYKITLWQEDQTDPNFLVTFGSSLPDRISKQDFEQRHVSKNNINVTLDLNA